MAAEVGVIRAAGATAQVAAQEARGSIASLDLDRIEFGARVSRAGAREAGHTGWASAERGSDFGHFGARLHVDLDHQERAVADQVGICASHRVEHAGGDWSVLSSAPAASASTTWAKQVSSAATKSDSFQERA